MHQDTPDGSPHTRTLIAADQERIQEQSRFVAQIRAEVGKVIIGQRYMIDRLLIGHGDKLSGWSPTDMFCSRACPDSRRP